jgi:hypothetical protein
MRGLFALIVTLLIAGIVGVGAYQLGVAQGLATTGTTPGAVAPVYYYHPFFFGGFGFLFPLLFIFLIFALIRGAFWGGRRYYGGGWGGYGQRERIEELHRELHGQTARDGGASSTPPTGR